MRRNYPGLDFIRFSAAAIVMLFHLAYWTWAAAPGGYFRLVKGSVSFPGLEPLTAWGWVGVQIFFVLSGVVISFSAESKSGYQFARSRFLRLYPAVWICASLSFGILLLAGARGFGSYVRSMLLYPGSGWVDGCYWTLGIEMSFYVMIFALLWTDRFRHAPRLFVLLAIVSSLFWISWLATHLLHFHEGFLEHLAVSRPMQLFLVPHGIYFALGGLIYVLSRRGLDARLLLCCLLCVAAAPIEISAEALRKAERIHAQAYPFTASIIWLVALSGILLSVIVKSEVAAKPLRTIGLMTYPLYLTHGVVGSMTMRLLRSAHLNAPVSLALAMVTSVSVAFIIVTLLEPPLRRVTAKIFDRRLGALPLPTLYRPAALF